MYCVLALITKLSPFSFQEGANINKSLTTLGKVISALAEVVLLLFYHIVLFSVNKDK